MSQLNPADLTYGSDRTGLVWGYHFKPEEPPQQIECSAALDWLSSGASGAATDGPSVASSEFLWLHFSLSNANAERWMRESLQLAEVFFDSLHEGGGSPHV